MSRREMLLCVLLVVVLAAAISGCSTTKAIVDTCRDGFCR